MKDLDKIKIDGEVKGRSFIYHLVTEDDLNSVDENNRLSDLFTSFFSASLGGLVTVIVTYLGGLQLIAIVIAFWVLVILTPILLCLMIFFISRRKKIIEKIEDSERLYDRGISEIQTGGKIISSDVENFRIINARYGIGDTVFDVTEKLNNRVESNKLEWSATNEIAGDPAQGQRKKLWIKYEVNGSEYNRVYDEDDSVILP